MKRSQGSCGFRFIHNDNIFQLEVVSVMNSLLFVPFHPKIPPPGWKCPKQFKLWLESPWESSDSEDDSEREIDNILIMASQQYEEKERSEQHLLMTSQQYEEKDGRQNEEDELDIDNLLIMASQQYKAKERRQNDKLGIVKED